MVTGKRQSANFCLGGAARDRFLPTCERTRNPGVPVRESGLSVSRFHMFRIGVHSKTRQFTWTNRLSLADLDVEVVRLQVTDGAIPHLEAHRDGQDLVARQVQVALL